MQKHSSYKSILKSTSLFGGVQGVSLLLSFVKMKVVALLLGTEGMGVLGLLNNTTEMITSATGLGLGRSAVRDLSTTADGKEKKQLIQTIRRWSLLAGLLGAIVTLSLAPKLSHWTFGNENHLWGFVWLSCTILFNTLAQGEKAILQGNRALKALAKGSLYGAITGLAVSLPLYYFFERGGIIPSIIVTAITTWGCFSFYSRRWTESEEKQPIKTSFHQGINMVKLGVFLTISSFSTTLCSYLFVALLNNQSGTADVGLYQAGYTLIERYVGLVFISMGTDYYPRLASVCSDNKQCRTLINRQSEISMLMLVPILLLLISLRTIVIELLYSTDFQSIETYIVWSGWGVLFKASAWSMGYLLLAKGNAKWFLWTEIASEATSILIKIIGYKYGGLAGVGMAYSLNFGLYLIAIYAIIRWKYNYSFQNSSVCSIFVISLLFVTMVIGTAIAPLTLSIKIGLYVLIGLSSSFFSVYHLYHKLKLNDETE